MHDKRMDGWEDRWMDGWVGGWTDDGWVDGRMDGWVVGWGMDGWLNGWVGDTLPSRNLQLLWSRGWQTLIQRPNLPPTPPVFVNKVLLKQPHTVIHIASLAASVLQQNRVFAAETIYRTTSWDATYTGS